MLSFLLSEPSMQPRKPRHPAQAISCDALTLLMLVDDGKLRTIRQGLPLSTKSDTVNGVVSENGK